MAITIYGLKTCDTCRKAVKALPDAAFRDIRATPLSASEVAAFLDAFGAALINRASTTWRGLDDTARALPPETLLQQYPALMKRPVTQEGDRLYLGWTPDVREALGLG